MIPFHRIVVILSCLFGSTTPIEVFAQAQNFNLVTIPDSYPKDYLFILHSHNEPLQPAKQYFASHQSRSGFAYMHRLSFPWIVSVGARSQAFMNRSTQIPTSILTLFNSTQRVYRLYHPLYLLLGTEIEYLIPFRKLNPPLAKDPDFNTEIGLGAKASLWYLLSTQWVISGEISRWRGTKTNRLHGMSLSLGVGMKI